MRVNLIKRLTIEDYSQRNGYKRSFEQWLSKLKYADWNSPQDIKRTFNTADLLGKGCHRIVFDIAGNNCRIICKYHFAKNKKKKRVHLYVCWIGNHKEYDDLCKASLQYTINEY